MILRFPAIEWVLNNQVLEERESVRERYGWLSGNQACLPPSRGKGLLAQF